jgi:hypothetical protein
MTPDQIITELRTRITQLELENTGLRNELWTANRTVYAHDPWEGEDA